MIVSGGVNIYPQEVEDHLLLHPKVTDAAVFGVPDADLGEQVKAVVQAMPGVAAGPELEAELLAYCRARLAHYKCPGRSTSRPSCRAATTASSTSGSCGTGTGRDTSPACSEPPGRRSAPLIYARSRWTSRSATTSSSSRRPPASSSSRRCRSPPSPRSPTTPPDSTGGGGPGAAISGGRRSSSPRPTAVAASVGRACSISSSSPRRWGVSCHRAPWRPPTWSRMRSAVVAHPTSGPRCCPGSSPAMSWARRCGAGPGGGWDGTGGSRRGATAPSSCSTVSRRPWRRPCGRTSCDVTRGAAPTAGSPSSWCPRGRPGWTVEPSVPSTSSVAAHTVRFDDARPSVRRVVGDLDGADAAGGEASAAELAIVLQCAETVGRSTGWSSSRSYLADRNSFGRPLASTRHQAPLRRHEDVVEACHGVTELAGRAVQRRSRRPECGAPPRRISVITRPRRPGVHAAPRAASRHLGVSTST